MTARLVLEQEVIDMLISEIAVSEKPRERLV